MSNLKIETFEKCETLAILGPAKSGECFWCGSVFFGPPFCRLFCLVKWWWEFTVYKLS